MKVANLLLEKETITHDDIIDLVGPRPSTDEAYQEYVSKRFVKKEKVEESAAEEEEANEDESNNTDNTPGGFTPGLAFKV